jgi:hypothetical protein
MNYKAKIKDILKLNKPAFGDGIFTYKITTSKHTGLYYTSKLSLKVNDEIEYNYVMQKNNDYKFKDVKKVAMYDNFSKQENIQAQVRLDTGRSILLQVAFKEASASYLAGKITVDEVEALTNKYYNIINK